MKRNTVKIAVFCLASAVIFSSCVKKTIDTATKPILKTSKTIWNSLSSLFTWETKKKTSDTENESPPASALEVVKRKLERGK